MSANRPVAEPGGATSSAERRVKPTAATPNQQDHDAALMAELRARWPEAFCDPPRPLAIGTHRWAARWLRIYPESKRWKALCRTFASWCGRAAYLEALAESGAKRFDLAGMPAGPVSPQHQADARERLAALGANQRRPTLRLGGRS